MRHRRRHLMGGLLIEALVSFMLFLIASLSLYALLATSHRASGRARQTVAATSLARDLLEQARARGYDRLKLGEESGRTRLQSQRGHLPGGLILSWKVSVTSAPDDLKSILVSVTWVQEPVATVELETYVAP